MRIVPVGEVDGVSVVGDVRQTVAFLECFVSIEDEYGYFDRLSVV